MNLVAWPNPTEDPVIYLNPAVYLNSVMYVNPGMYPILNPCSVP